MEKSTKKHIKDFTIAEISDRKIENRSLANNELPSHVNLFHLKSFVTFQEKTPNQFSLCSFTVYEPMHGKKES